MCVHSSTALLTANASIMTATLVVVFFASNASSVTQKNRRELAVVFRHQTGKRTYSCRYRDGWIVLMIATTR